MKIYHVSYRLRGANYKFMTPHITTIRANSVKEVRNEFIMTYGDIYKVVKVVEVK